MKFLEYVKRLGLLDVVMLSMLDMGYSPTEIASKVGTTRQTIYDAKKRNESLLEYVESEKEK
jgi:predicted DNA-binding protein YlxM (UPF0122 family)